MTIKFIKDKETKTKVRYTATGDVSGSIYIEKDSELAKDSEIIFAGAPFLLGGVLMILSASIAYFSFTKRKNVSETVE